MKYLLLLFCFGCATQFNFPRCVAEAQRLGLTHDQALQSCEVERTTDRREFRHQTNRWRNH